MLQEIEISPGDAWRYKSDPPEYVPAGIYYMTRSKLPDQLKKATGAIPVATSNIPFAWLLPCERWVRILFASRDTPAELLVPELTVLGKVDIEDPSNGAEIMAFFNCPVGLWSKLRRWQKQFLSDACYSLQTFGYYRREGGAPLGGGKSLVGLILAQRDIDHALVCAPKYLFGDWAEQAKLWGLRLPQLSTYESCDKASTPDGKPFAILVGDEILLVKNPSTRRHHNFSKLSNRAQTVVGLTGTPSSVAPYDLRHLRAVLPGCVPATENGWRHLFGLDTALVEIPGTDRKAYKTTKWNHDFIARMTSYALRIVSADEIKADLPEISFRRLTVPPPMGFAHILRGSATQTTKAKALAQARQASSGSFLNDLGVPVRLGDSKQKVIKEFVDNLGEPVVIFSAWDHVVLQLADLFADHTPSVLRGEDGANYSTSIERFKRGETVVLIASAKISMGMNLQGVCNTVVFESWDTSPIARQQAIARVYRPGQSRGVNIVDVVAEKTLDERTLQLLTEHQNETQAFVTAALEEELRRLTASAGTGTGTDAGEAA